MILALWREPRITLALRVTSVVLSDLPDGDSGMNTGIQAGMRDVN